MTNEKKKRQGKERIAELEKSQQMLLSITHANPSIIYIYDLVECRNVYTNDFTEKVLGYSADEIQAMGNQLMLCLFHPDEVARLRARHESIRQSVRNSGSERVSSKAFSAEDADFGQSAASDRDIIQDGDILDVEYRLKCADNQWRWFYGREMVFSRSANGQPKQIMGCAIDIDKRKKDEAELVRHREHLEELVASRAAELHTANKQLTKEIQERKRVQSQLIKRARALERSNTDLEQFAYVISHDLQEPLRAMTVFSQLLSQRYSHQLDDTAAGYIKHVVEGGIRMQALIDGILAFSRITHNTDTFEQTDTASVLAIALKNLQTALTEAQANVTYDALPTLPADSNQITQLFQNLIGNAIKFRSDKPPRIHISAEQQDDRWLFSVQDNGIGIPSEQQSRIFDLFQRLHTHEEQEGYGIGLAICKKIVQRHNGVLSVDSKPREGTVFCFTLPA